MSRLPIRCGWPRAERPGRRRPRRRGACAIERVDAHSAAVRHERMRACDVELHVARAGEGPLVILLHGFPENWTSWHHQIPALVAAGFSVMAPDMRGYNLSDRPPERDDYRLRLLIDDVAE